MFRGTRWALAASTLLTILCIVAVDDPVARFVATRDPWIWSRVIGVLEYGLGLEPWKWLGICVLVAGTVASLVVPRLRSQAAAWLLVTLTHLFARNFSFWTQGGP